MKNLILTITALLFTISISAQTVVDAAVSNKDFSTLVTALKAADLVGALSGEGPFTVFAPNNEAFSKIDATTLGNLLKPENVKALSNILTYHVVSGKLMASDVANALKRANEELDKDSDFKLEFMESNGNVIKTFTNNKNMKNPSPTADTRIHYQDLEKIKKFKKFY